ncbi:MAG TPA: choice-of-anchor Q domain-containing protein, partial [Polyangiaceae bacterium]|nr:choice-of-anchor Q domain-containing protein [Polyangiaceae bacterium]
CRKCESGSECPSLACDIKGRCADETSVVYALAGTGSYDATCGTKASPCISVGTAASMLSSSRPYLVLIKTSTGFNDTMTIPPGLDAHVFGNGQKISAYSSPPGPGIIISGGNVVIDDLIVEQTNVGSSSNPTAAIACSEGNLKLLRVELTNTDTDYNAVGLRLEGCSAGVQQSTFTGNRTALVSSPGLGGPVNTLTVERSLFQGNVQALDFSGDSFTIRNNLFIANGQTSYVRIIKPGAETSGVFAYNTLYSNDNNCSYEGGLIACEYGNAKCGIQSSNLFWHNMFGGSGNGPCYDQVYETPAPAIKYTLAEATWPGDGNVNADPLLKDPDNGDYTPGSGSPAIDAGDEDPNVVPDVDYFGNPRPQGAHPDIGAIEAE